MFHPVVKLLKKYVRKQSISIGLEKTLVIGMDANIFYSVEPKLKHVSLKG